jgi:hypothetical protein
MSENAKKVVCPECNEEVEPVDVFDRRDFMWTAAMAAAAVTVPAVARAADDTAVKKKEEKPAEALIKELHSTFSADQKKELVLPWNHGAEKGLPTRLGMYNAPILGKKIGTSYTQPQQELVERIIKAISSGDDGYQRISRNGKWDSSGSLQGAGAILFGEPKDGEKFAFVVTSHHLTVRCDGNSEEGAAFGGPMYYGHSPNGYSPNNVWFYQTKSVISTYDMLNEEQRKKAELNGSPGEHAPSVKFRKAGEAHPGLAYADLTADQKKLVETVMRDVLSPFRKEDADAVMKIVKANGGMEKIHLAFYKDMGMNDNMRWHFWRLEGPGFVWNYRVLPHVHTYVNISSKVG